MDIDNPRSTFLKTWTGGYRENWEVYGKASGKTEHEVVGKCLSPFYNINHTVLEVGCGLGFWTEKYLSPNFKSVVAIDITPDPKLLGNNIQYIEVPDRNFDCYGVEDDSIDFCWSFGVFCHLSLPACQKYLFSIFNKLKSGARVSLYFSNTDRRPQINSKPFDVNEIRWTTNDYKTTEKIMYLAGFIDVHDLMPDLIDTMISGTKP